MIRDETESARFAIEAFHKLLQRSPTNKLRAKGVNTEVAVAWGSSTLVWVVPIMLLIEWINEK